MRNTSWKAKENVKQSVALSRAAESGGRSPVRPRREESAIEEAAAKSGDGPPVRHPPRDRSPEKSDRPPVRLVAAKSRDDPPKGKGSKSKNAKGKGKGDQKGKGSKFPKKEGSTADAGPPRGRRGPRQIWKKEAGMHYKGVAKDSPRRDDETRTGFRARTAAAYKAGYARPV